MNPGRVAGADGHGDERRDADDLQLARRRAAWVAPPPHYTRGFGTLYLKHATQANEGCDCDFLEAGASTPDPEIH